MNRNFLDEVQVHLYTMKHLQKQFTPSFRKMEQEKKELFQKVIQFQKELIKDMKRLDRLSLESVQGQEKKDNYLEQMVEKKKMQTDMMQVVLQSHIFQSEELYALFSEIELLEKMDTIALSLKPNGVHEKSEKRVTVIEMIRRTTVLEKEWKRKNKKIKPYSILYRKLCDALMRIKLSCGLEEKNFLTTQLKQEKSKIEEMLYYVLENQKLEKAVNVTFDPKSSIEKVLRYSEILENINRALLEKQLQDVLGMECIDYATLKKQADAGMRVLYERNLELDYHQKITGFYQAKEVRDEKHKYDITAIYEEIFKQAELASELQLIEEQMKQNKEFVGAWEQQTKAERALEKMKIIALSTATAPLLEKIKSQFTNGTFVLPEEPVDPLDDIANKVQNHPAEMVPTEELAVIKGSSSLVIGARVLLPVHTTYYKDLHIQNFEASPLVSEQEDKYYLDKYAVLEVSTTGHFTGKIFNIFTDLGSNAQEFIDFMGLREKQYSVFYHLNKGKNDKFELANTERTSAEDFGWVRVEELLRQLKKKEAGK